MNAVNDPKGEAGAKKAPMWLLPPVALEQTAWVHKLGSDKYGRLVPVLASSCGEELVEFCSCEPTTEKQHVTQTGPTLPAAYASNATSNNALRPGGLRAIQEESPGLVSCANRVTTPSSFVRTQSTPRGSERTTLTGSPAITMGTWSESEPMASDLRLKTGLAPTDGPPPFQLTGCLSTTSPESSLPKEVAGFVGGRRVAEDSTSTTRPSSFGGSCATDATKGLASSETIERLLRRHSLTCSARSLQIREGHVWQRGDFNWRRTGVCATTYVSAIMRHLNAWRDGEDLDPESGISHIAHIATSCNILMDAEACGTLQDDRNKRTAVLTREEAFQKLVESPPSVRVKVVDNDIKPDDYVEGWFVNGEPFDGHVTNVLDVRGTKVFQFSDRPSISEDQIYTITHA